MFGIRGAALARFHVAMLQLYSKRLIAVGGADRGLLAGTAALCHLSDHANK